MGPYATAQFFKNILDLTPAKKDWDHVRIVIDNNPHIPSRSRAILYGEESPVNGMIDTCARLSAYPVDFIVVPCNSACYFLPEVQKNIKTPILNIIEIAADVLVEKIKNGKRVSVLGGGVTYLKETYKDSLERRGYCLVHHDNATQDKVTELIERVKLGEGFAELIEIYHEIIETVKKNKTEGVILACTELSVFKDVKIGMPVVDSSHVLAEYAIQVAMGKKEIPLDIDIIHKFWEDRAHMLMDGKVSDYQSTLLTPNAQQAEERDAFEKMAILKYVKKYSNSKGRAVDFGCGIGRLTELLTAHFAYIDACDYCEEFITKAQERARIKNLKNINYRVSSVENFKSEYKYDFAFSAGLMIFLNDEQFSKLVSIIADTIKNDGVCIIRESMGTTRRFELHNYYSKIIDSIYNAVYRSAEEIVDEFHKHGFVLKEEEITILPKPEKPETCQKILILEKQPK